MLEVNIKNSLNETVGTLPLNEVVFGEKVNGPLLHEVVLMQQASMRQGTASTKTRGFVSGGGKKPWKQKGTGRARAGSSRSPLWRGGATIFGPLPRKYNYSIPKKKARKALYSAISSKVADGQLVVLSEWGVTEPKTKQMVALLKTLGIERRVLIVMPEVDDLVIRAARNLQSVDLLDVSGLNVYDLLASDFLLTTQAGIERITAYWGGAPGGAASVASVPQAVAG